MDKLLAVIRREYVETVRTRSFAISTALVPLLMGLMIFIPGVLARSTPDVATRLAVLDRTGKILPALDKELASDPNAHFLKNGQRRYPVIDAAAGGAVSPAELEALDNPWQVVRKLDVDALVEIKAGALQAGPQKDQVVYYSTNVGDFMPMREVEAAVNAVIPSLRLAGTGLDRQRILEATQHVDVTSIKISEAGRSAREFSQEWVTAMMFTITLYTTTLMAGLALSRGLLEEKANRVVEVLISSVTPFQLMTGKILGQGMVILSQLAVWSLLGTALYMRGMGGSDAQKVLEAINPGLLAYLVVYFLLGYFLYASLFAAVGAICTTEMEAQQTQTPLVIMQVFPLVMAVAIVRMPGGTLATTLSMIPFFAPSVMMIRMAVQPPPFIQVAASILLLIMSVFVAFWAVSRIFRVGILMTGKKMTIQEIVRWLRTA